MEYYEQGNLRDYVINTPIQAEPWAREVIRQILGVLVELTASELAHRNITPSVHPPPNIHLKQVTNITSEHPNCIHAAHPRATRRLPPRQMAQRGYRPTHPSGHTPLHRARNARPRRRRPEALTHLRHQSRHVGSRNHPPRDANQAASLPRTASAPLFRAPVSALPQRRQAGGVDCLGGQGERPCFVVCGVYVGA